MPLGVITGAFAGIFAKLEGGELIGSVVLVVIGLAFIALAPAKPTVERVSATIV
jgi:hypothetical protein